jgi:DNA-binding transcriptional MerR regulator
MLIGELAKRSGLSRDTIRYYEKLQLLPRHGPRHDNRYKDYGRPVLARLEQIQQLKVTGFTLREVRQLLVSGDTPHPCANLPQQLARKISAIDQQMATLAQFKSSLTSVLQACNGQCTSADGMPSCVPGCTPYGTTANADRA